MKYLPFLLAILLFASCESEPKPVSLQSGLWRGSLDIDAERPLPFQFEISQNGDQYQWTILNGEERLVVDEIERRGDSLFVRMPVFDSEFHLAITSEKQLMGKWHNYSRGKDYQIPFQAEAGTAPRFTPGNPAGSDLAGVWETTFSPGVQGDAYPAIGVFENSGDRLLGTFQTETGDYRFLEGIVDGNTLLLSCFDGAHAFMFEAKLGEDDSLRGTFWSGNHWFEPWVAGRNPEAALRSPEELTYLKEGYDRFNFNFPNLQDQTVSLDDERFADKVVLVQIMGSWCPNCLDESKLYKKWYDRYKDQGLEIVGLAFERSGGDTEVAKRNIQRLQDKIGLDYPILVAAADNNKGKAAEKLPMLNHVLSYPTSIYIDKQQRVRRIHTGFNGPGTGEVYARFVEEYEGFLEKLLAE